MIIVEGMDNSGKTTLCNKLVELLPGHHIEKISETRRPTQEEYIKYFGESLMEGEDLRSIIRDRSSWVSELVYGDVLRGGSVLGKGHMELLKTYIHSRVFCIVYCNPPRETLLKNMGEQMDEVKEQVEVLCTQYDGVMQFIWGCIQSSPNPGVILLDYNWTDPNTDDKLSEFIDLYHTLIKENP